MERVAAHETLTKVDDFGMNGLVGQQSSEANHDRYGERGHRPMNNSGRQIALRDGRR
jgi:hypothetical protein